MEVYDNSDQSIKKQRKSLIILVNFSPAEIRFLLSRALHEPIQSAFTLLWPWLVASFVMEPPGQSAVLNLKTAPIFASERGWAFVLAS
jgi:hypothetical protein